MPKKNATDEAADRIRHAILRGEHAAGADLPPERELATRLGVSRLTLRAAIARLAAEGLVLPVHGSGTRVLDYRRSGGVDLVGYLAALAIEGGQVPVSLLADLLEVRRAIAVETVGLLAERATPGEIAELRARVAAQRSLVGDAPRFRAADLDFARHAVRATHNLALELLFNTIARMIEGHRGLDAAFDADPEQTLALYEYLLDLIEERGATAREEARRLLVRLDRRIVARASELAQAVRPGGAA